MESEIELENEHGYDDDNDDDGDGDTEAEHDGTLDVEENGYPGDSLPSLDLALGSAEESEFDRQERIEQQNPVSQEVDSLLEVTSGR